MEQNNNSQYDISAVGKKMIITVSNNKAQYYSDLAKKYKEEAKVYKDQAKYYSEQNTNVTYEYIDAVKTELESELASKQEQGDYALKSEIPVNVSELENDSNYITLSELDETKASLMLPSQENNAGKFLKTDGTDVSWDNVSSFNLFDTKLTDHVLEGDEAVGWALQGSYVYKEAASELTGYPDFYAKCIAEKNAGTLTETVLGTNTINTYVNVNGHVYFDIADKTAVDAFFNTYGACWMYGIDTENERIFLPRNNWFEQATASEAGKFIEPGLPNITGSAESYQWGNSTAHTEATTYSGAFSISAGGSSGTSQASGSNVHLDFNASKSNSVYGNSNTVQPASVKKLLYICVGNIITGQGMTNVSEITTSENDTLPLFFSYYSILTPDSAAFVEANGSYLSGSVYVTAYNKLVSLLNLDNKVKAYGNETITDYDFVINQDDMTFRLPLKNGNEDMSTGKLYYKISNAVQNLQLLDASEVLDSVNTKADIDLANCTKPYITETYNNGKSWYKIYSNGWSEQGGSVTTTATNAVITSVYFVKQFSEAPVNIILTPISSVANDTGESFVQAAYVNGFAGGVDNMVSTSGTKGFYWRACGYID